MMSYRVIPCLLLQNQGLVKTTRFNNPRYVGDPLNAIRIFNDKEVDELIFFDISASKENRMPLLKIISEISSECFMPLCYGGGISSMEEMQTVFSLGVEKIAINTQAIKNPLLIKQASEKFGSQSIVVTIDVKKSLFGKYQVFSHLKGKSLNLNPVEFAIRMEELGAGELLVNSVDRDGTMSGYDNELLKKITDAVTVPVIACGGAGNLDHLSDAVHIGGVSAVSAGSMFVFHGKHRAVLINYPTQQEITKIFTG